MKEHCSLIDLYTACCDWMSVNHRRWFQISVTSDFKRPVRLYFLKALLNTSARKKEDILVYRTFIFKSASFNIRAQSRITGHLTEHFTGHFTGHLTLCPYVCTV